MVKQNKKNRVKRKTKPPRKPKSKTSFIYIAFVLVVIATLAFFNLTIHFSPIETQAVLSSQTNTNNKEAHLIYWEKIVSENPQYIDGWIELAKIRLERGDILGTLQALDTARKIDPNSESLEDFSKNIIP